MKRAYIADSLIDGQLVADWLSSNGIPCEVFHQNGSGALGELPVTSPEVWVKRDPDLDKADHLINLMFSTDKGPAIRCSQCEEANPPGFDICWQCQSPLPVF